MKCKVKIKDMKNLGLLALVFFSLFGTKLNATDLPWEASMKSRLEKLADSLTTHLLPWDVPDKVFKVEDYGAKADGSTLNTQFIQAAIDSCSAAGGGTVLFSNGDYVTGTLQIKSGVMIEVAGNSRILGSTHLEDYPEMIEGFESIMSHYYQFRQSLIYAEKADKIGIRGKGEIYFRGERENFPGPQTIGKIEGRPLGIRMIECKNIVFQDIFLRNSAAWMVNAVYCENIIFDGVTIENHANYNNDGFDPDGCRNLIVRNCFFNTEDDAMCPKGGSNRMSENYLIENSTFLTTCNAFKIGTDTQGPFRNIIARNLILGGIPDSLPTSSGRQSSTGITIATVDGGNVSDFYMSNITINQARCPVFIRIGKRGRVLPGLPKNIGHIQNIFIENVTGENNFTQGSFISGIPDKQVENIIIRNCSLGMIGEGTMEMAGNPVTENEYGYPDAHQFSVSGLPAFGFYVRHAKDIVFDNVKITPSNKDERPGFISGGNVQNVSINGKGIEEQTIKVYHYTPKHIKDVSVASPDAKFKTDSARVGGMPYMDRSFRFTALSDKLIGAEYICWQNNLKSHYAENLLTCSFAKNGMVYIAHDGRIPPPEWLTRNFNKTSDIFQLSGGDMVLYGKKAKKGETLRLGANQVKGSETGECNHYIMFFVNKK
jgi:polygalacturonase